MSAIRYVNVSEDPHARERSGLPADAVDMAVALGFTELGWILAIDDEGWSLLSHVSRSSDATTVLALSRIAEDASASKAGEEARAAVLPVAALRMVVGLVVLAAARALIPGTVTAHFPTTNVVVAWSVLTVVLAIVAMRSTDRHHTRFFCASPRSR